MQLLLKFFTIIYAFAHIMFGFVSAPCLVSIEEMDKRNIEIRSGGKARMYCPHMDHVTFACQRGRYRKRISIDFRQQCLYGHMQLPECE